MVSGRGRYARVIGVSGDDWDRMRGVVCYGTQGYSEWKSGFMSKRHHGFFWEVLPKYEMKVVRSCLVFENFLFRVIF